MGSSKPSVSVIVACRNEAHNIGALLSCLTCQDYPADRYEIIIVNDNSVDGTADAVRRYTEVAGLSDGLRIRLIDNPGQGKKSALRHGADTSAGEVLLTTDADCRVGRGWITAYATCFGKGVTDMIIGPVMERSSGSVISCFSALEFSALQGITALMAEAGRPVMCNGANLGYRREVFLRHYKDIRESVRSGDDMYMLHSVKRGGGIIRYAGCGAAAVETAAAVSAAALLRQRARWASKSFGYTDADTLILAAATAACNAAVTAAAITAAFKSHLLPFAAVLFAIKALPDYLMIRYDMKKRKEQLPLPSFIISEIVYPFYFSAVALLSLLPASRRFKARP